MKLNVTKVGVNGRYAILYSFCVIILFCAVYFCCTFPGLKNKLNWEEKWIGKLLILNPLHHICCSIFDVIQECFKDECYFFALLNQIIVFAIYSLTANSCMHSSDRLGSTHYLIQSYKERCHNCVVVSNSVVYHLSALVFFFVFYVTK